MQKRLFLFNKLQGGNNSGNRKSRSVLILSYCATGIFIAAALYFVLSSGTAIDLLDNLTVSAIVIVAILFALNIFLRGVQNLLALRVMDIHLGFLESFCLSGGTTMINFLMPLPGGVGFRAIYLNKKHGLPYELFASVLVALHLMGLWGSALLGLIALLVLSGPMSHAATVMGLALGGCVVGSGLVMAAAMLYGSRQSHSGRLLARFGLGFALLLRDKFLMISVLLLNVSIYFTGALSLLVAFAAVKLPSPFAGCMLLQSAMELGGIISITPGSLGFQELAGSFCALVLPATWPEILTVLAVVRVVRVGTAAAFGAFALHMLRRLSRRGAGSIS